MNGRGLAAVFTLVILLTAHAGAQEPSPTPGQKAEPVRLGVTFSDEKGRPAPEVRREDVRVFVDGVEQPLTLFEREEAPASYGLIVDNSGSLRHLMNYVIASAIAIVETNRPGDETFVVRFVANDVIQRLIGFTSDKAALRNAVESMYVEGGQTAVLDAVYAAADYAEKNAAPDESGRARRRALVLITDGEDRDSRRKLDDVLRLLKRARIQVYCVGLVGELDNERGIVMKGKRDKAEALLKRLAGETGGRLLLVDKVQSELLPALNSVAADLHTTYVVGYTPPAAPGARSPGKIEVKVLERKGAPKLKAVVHPPADAAVPDPKKKS